MKARRRFLAGLLVVAAAPLGAQPKRAHRIGMLETVPIAANTANLGEFHKGMQELGYAEGTGYFVLYRSSEGRPERFPALAAELARQNVDLFLTRGTPAALAAVRHGRPVVAAAIADPVDSGLAASLEAPGGRLTGLASSTNELGPKRLELLKALAPAVTRVGALVNPGNPASLAAWKAIEAAAPAQRLAAQMIDVRRPAELAAAIAAAAERGIDGLLVGTATLTPAAQAAVIEAAALHRLPAIYADRQFVDAGGLASYGAAYGNLYYRAAEYVDKILKGAAPGALAMGQPTKLEFVINRRTAHALGLAIPPDLLLRSDDVVE
jgi:putative tryptophan/tyrosine transport system substrate-binding protein